MSQAQDQSGKGSEDKGDNGNGKGKDEITIVAPNGADKPYKYHPHDTVKKTVDAAVKDFAKEGLLDPKIQYQLVRTGGTVLEDSLTLEQAGVKAGDRLSLRSVDIPGDGHASGTL